MGTNPGETYEIITSKRSSLYKCLYIEKLCMCVCVNVCVCVCFICLRECERPVKDIMGTNPGETCEMELQARDPVCIYVYIYRNCGCV